jgi:hypothetical protein
MKKERKRGRKKIEVDLMTYENPLNALVEKNRSKLKKYTSFVYDNQTYSVGDDVMILNKEDYLLSYLCRIRELVLWESPAGRFLPMLKAQWYASCLTQVLYEVQHQQEVRPLLQVHVRERTVPHRPRRVHQHQVDCLEELPCALLRRL